MHTLTIHTIFFASSPTDSFMRRGRKPEKSNKTHAFLYGKNIAQKGSTLTPHIN